MPDRAWLKGQEIAEEERQMQLQNEAAERVLARERLAVEIAAKTYGSDDVEITSWVAERDRRDDLNPRVESVDGGYWVSARVWVDAEDVEERLVATTPSLVALSDPPEDWDGSRPLQ